MSTDDLAFSAAPAAGGDGHAATRPRRCHWSSPASVSARGGSRGIPHGRSRARAAAPRRARRVEARASADAHRPACRSICSPASSCSTTSSIEGLTPADRPFLKAGRLAIGHAWSTLIHREVLLDSIEMTDWQMVVETFPRRPQRSRSSRRRQRRQGPKRFTTTIRYIRASRGQFTFEDHGVPWSTVAPQPRRHRRAPRRLPRPGALPRRHRSDPELRADARRHAGVVPHRRRQDQVSIGSHLTPTAPDRS